MFHHIHGKNIVLSQDSSQATRINGFCQGITFSNTPLTQLQRITFQICSDSVQSPVSLDKQNKKPKKALYNGILRIGLTSKNPITFTELPIISYPALLNTDGFWITTIKSSYLKKGNKISLILDKENSLQLSVNYVLKATLFGNKLIQLGTSAKLWLILDLYGNTKQIQFLPSDYTPYEIKARGLDAVNNFHSACISGGSKSIFKTRLIILGQERSGKTALRNSLINTKNIKKASNNNCGNNNNNSKFNRNTDVSASIRVKVDKTTNLWHPRNLKKNEFSDDKKNKKLRRHNSNSDIHYLQVPVNTLKTNHDENNNNNTTSTTTTATRINKRRSSSTSYLNEKDDYDDDYDDYTNGEYLKKFRRQFSLEERDDKSGTNLNDNKNTELNDGNSSVTSLDESDSSDNDSNADLYSIDETFENDINQSDELKKDPTGYYYKKIAMNIYQELYTSKIYEKLWPTTTSENETNMNNNFTESFFEKLALQEFESSIYNQLEYSRILKIYYEKIIYNEMKLIQSKTSTILVNPFIKKQSSLDSDTNLNTKNLSLNILDFDGPSFFYTTHQIFLSSRAVYLFCFDLTKDLNDLALTNFEFVSKKNNELTNLDYLDFWMRSIHSHAAKMPDNMSANLESVQTNETYTNTIKIDENYTINFKKSVLSPPIIIVGTFKNNLPGDHITKNDLIKQKFYKIKEFISNKVYNKHIVEPYFAVDTFVTESCNEDKKETNNNNNLNEIEALKKVIELVSINESYMGEQQPIKWMKFENSLEKLKSKGLFYASLSQICEIAHEKEIKTQEELTTCLNFFHDLGVIIYYGNANDIFLRNTIILRPQKLVDIFKLVLGARIPNSLLIEETSNVLNENQQQYTKAKQSSKQNLFNSTFNPQWAELWKKFDRHGILDDRLIDFLWNDYIDQKPGLLGLMKKFDLICERNVASPKAQFNKESLNREYLLPSRATIKYQEDFNDDSFKLNNLVRNQTFIEDESEDNIEDLTDSNYARYNNNNRYKKSFNNISTIEFYYDFCGFLPESLFHRILTRAAHWTLLKNGANPETAVRLYWRKARFYLDDLHDFVIEMAGLKYARLKIQVIRLNPNINGFINGQSPPEPNACAKIRNFMESVLIDLRNLWMKRLTFNACVQCCCDKVCQIHQFEMCTHNQCIHFLNLDECLTNNIVYCEYRRVKTLIYKSWFPTQNISLHKGPVLAAVKTYSDNNMFYDESSLPNWIKNVAKLLQANSNFNNSKEKDNKDGQIMTIQNENDWLALARLLGYNKSKINYFMEAQTPALQMICDWIMSSDNTNLTIEFLLNYLEQLKRDDAIKIINNERENETINSSVFISYQWDSQDEVIRIKDCLEKSGFKCFMDIGQIGAGNLLYQKIDQAIRNAKVVIACITPKFVISNFCNREMALADLLRKPIVPIMLFLTPWPPPGGMSLIFSQLVYVDYYGVGGHGGVGMRADREQRNNEIVAMVSRHVNPSSYFLMNIDRITDNDQNQITRPSRKSATMIRGSSQFYQNQNHHHNNNNNSSNNSNMFVTEIPSDRNYFQNNSNANNPVGGGRFRNGDIEHNRSAFTGHTLNNRINSSHILNQSQSQNDELNNQQLTRPKCAICSIL